MANPPSDGDSAVERIDPDFFARVGEEALTDSEILENRAAPPGVGDAAALEAFDKSLDGRTARLVDYGVRAPEVIADAVRHVLGRMDLPDEEALALALSPARNPYRLEKLNVSTHAPIMRALAHAHFVFRKKLSHTADSQDQRHRTVPGSRPMLSRTVPACVDVVEPQLVADDPACHAIFRETVEAQWHARARLMGLGVEPAKMKVAHIHRRDGAGLLDRPGVGHHLDAAGDDEVGHAAHDVGSGEVDRGDARAAETVEGKGGSCRVPARVEDPHAADAGSLLADL